MTGNNVGVPRITFPVRSPQERGWTPARCRQARYIYSLSTRQCRGDGDPGSQLGNRLHNSPAGAMTQQPQEGFDRSAEDAWEWMKAVQARLHLNDDTRGPRAALEARLRETEVCRGRGLSGLGPWPGPPAQAPGLACSLARWTRLVFLKLPRVDSPRDFGLGADSAPGGRGGPEMSHF